MSVALEFSTYEQGVASRSFRSLRRDLRDAVVDGEDGDLEEVVEHVQSLMVLAIAEGILAATSKLRDQVRRLAAVLAAGEQTAAVQRATATLDGIDKTLDVAGAMLHVRETKRLQGRQNAALTERLLDELRHGPARTSELAEKLNVDPTQVSRLLTTLRGKGIVATETVESDGRVRIHSLADQASASAEALAA